MNPTSLTIPPLNAGIIGCGNIFPAYAKGCTLFRALKLAACADLDMNSARKRAEEFSITATDVPSLLAAPSIDLIINLTIPKVHAQISTDAIRAGKHVYSEKPLALDTQEGETLLKLAAQKKLRIGCAPDTFLGAGLQTSRKLIDDGWIGRPLSATAFMLGSGPESWHPNPSFFYARGGGPMLDMGPYYITALIHLLGPVKTVSAMATRASDTRLATCKEQFGKTLPVEIPTHNSGTLLFANGAIATVVISFDVKRHTHRPIEIYGTEGSISIPDPNTFGGPVSIFRPGNDDWAQMSLTHGYRENSRSIGAADMAHAIRSGRPHRCNGQLALHVLEVMNAFELSQTTRTWIEIRNQCPQPSAIPLGLPPGLLDA